MRYERNPEESEKLLGDKQRLSHGSTYDSHTQAADGGTCCPCCSRATAWCFPLSYYEEFKEQVKLAFPAVCLTVFSVFIGLTALIFCGRLGTVAMDAVGLSNTIINITVLSIALGLSEGCDTLFAQAYGSKNKKLMGVYLQRALVIMFLASLLSVTLIINIEAICIALGQDREVSRLVGNYLTRFVPGAMSYFMYNVLMRYLQDMNHVVPTMITVIFGNVVNICLHYAFVVVLGWGINGSAISQSLSYMTMLLSTIAYLLISGAYKPTWPGWSPEIVRGWIPMMKLGVGGVLSLCFEWWCFELGVFLAGLLGNVDLAAQSLCMNMDSIVYNVPAGIGIAASIRVGQHLGAGNAPAAKTASHVALTICLVPTMISVILLLTLNGEIPKIFTGEKDVIEATAKLLPVLALYNLFDSVCGVAQGIFRGSGRLLTMAAGIFVIYYCVGLPFAVSLMFLTPLRGMGFWLGMSGALCIMAITMLILITTTNWDKQVIRASKNVSHLPQEIDSGNEEEQQTMLLPKYGRRYSYRSVDEQFYKNEDILPSDTLIIDTPENYSSLFLQKALVVLVVLGILATGVCCRLFIPLPPLSVDPGLYTNATFLTTVASL